MKGLFAMLAPKADFKHFACLHFQILFNINVMIQSLEFFFFKKTFKKT